jgi:glutathione S-transferase
MEQSLQLSSSASENRRSKHENRIVVGYYNLRGKAQVCRLLCEYLGVEYQDKLFSLAEWQRFNNEKARDWSFPCLPYLREGTFIVTESVPMCVYVINRFGTPDLLGKTLRDQGIVDMYIWTIEYMGNVITINCQQKSAEELKRFKEIQWAEKVYPRLLKIEQAVVGKEWFLEYLTIIDFSIYELIRYMDFIFENQTSSLPKLKRIETAVRNLAPIKEYEESPRAIVEWCPTKLLEGLRSMTNKPSN